MTTTYTPPNIAASVESMLDLYTAKYGAFPFSNDAIAKELGYTRQQVTGAIGYLTKQKKWLAVRGPIELLADPRQDKHELRRLFVLVPAEALTG